MLSEVRGDGERVKNLSEEEKRKLSLEFFAQEQSRLSSRTASVLDVHRGRMQTTLARSERQHRMMTSLAQNGISWGELKSTFDTAVEKGKNDMIQLNMGYFYSGMAIAFKEAMSIADTDTVLDFLHAVAVRMGSEESAEDIIRSAENIVNLDLKVYDTPPRPISKGSRKDRAAVERMKRTGITKADLEYEAEIGYQHGRNSEFFHSACYAAVVLVLHDQYGWEIDQIEAFIERVNDLRYEEINRKDILDRAMRETDIDVEEIV